MKRAFIFDLDGVLINDEAIWEAKKQAMYDRVFGKEIHAALGSTLGVNMDSIYERAQHAGSDVAKEVFIEEFHALAEDIYPTAPIPDGTDDLISALRENNFRVAVVSASPMSWITAVIERLAHGDDLELLISLHDRPDLEHKPNPDGYLEAMRALDAEPTYTFVLEDSNAGILSAKAAGAVTIGLRQNLVEGYRQSNADYYAETMDDVMGVIHSHTSQPA